MTPIAVRERLLVRPSLLVPVGTTEQHGPHLPLGCDTIIVERLADDLSTRYGITRTPALEYGAHTPTHPFPGGAALRRKTLHRVMNELIGSWEEGAGVSEFIVLTAQANDPHLEALSTIRTGGASVIVMDIFGLDFGGLLEEPGPPIQGGELDTSLLLFIAPELVHMELAPDRKLDPAAAAEVRAGAEGSGAGGRPFGAPSLASVQKGERLYRFIFERVSRCLTRL
jgi:creatinine amidohydrolase/Fe(II)-dependent formamide hydrolase-like protein